MKYNHAYSICFTVDSDNTDENITAKELLEGLSRRFKDLIGSEEILEAVGKSFDTYEN